MKPDPRTVIRDMAPTDRKRVHDALDGITIQDTLPGAGRARVLCYVIGYAIGGLRALGISKSVIERVLVETLDDAP